MKRNVVSSVVLFVFVLFFALAPVFVRSAEAAGTSISDIQRELGIVPAGVAIAVEKGDTYSNIARKFCNKGLKSLAVLVRANRMDIAEANLIFPGDSIFIPSALLRKEFRAPLRNLSGMKKEISEITAANIGLKKNLEAVQKDFYAANDTLAAVAGEKAKLETGLAAEKNKSENLRNLADRNAMHARYATFAALALFFVLAIAIFAIVLLRKEVTEKVQSEIKLITELFSNKTNQTKLETALKEPRMRIEFATGEKFTFPERRDNEGNFLIGPFYMEGPDGKKEYAIRSRDRARDTIKSFIKRTLGGVEVPEVSAAIKKYELVRIRDKNTWISKPSTHSN